MERYFIFDKYNTRTDWDLVLISKTITPPEPKTNYVNIDGMDGTLDLSEVLTGEPTYKDRVITATFWTDNGNRSEREKLFRDITAALHGRKIQIIEPDDTDHYFIGRVVINSNKNVLAYLEFSITITCEPWRYAIDDITTPVSVSKPINVVMSNNGVKTVCPTITVVGTVTITYNDLEVKLNDGTYKLSHIKLKRGNNILSLSGSGTVIITYREADL